VVVIEVINNIPADRGTHEFFNTGSHGLNMASAFVSFAFSFAAHAILPTVYESMAKPKQFNVMLSITFGVVLCFYIPMSVVGYYAFGSNTLSPIYDNLCSDGAMCTYSQQLGKWLAVLAITAHVMMSFPVIINTTERAVSTKEWFGNSKLTIRSA
jgi:amino acid permease